MISHKVWSLFIFLCFGALSTCLALTPNEEINLVETLTLSKPLICEEKKNPDPFAPTITREITFNENYSLQGKYYPNESDMRYFLWQGQFAKQSLLGDKTSLFIDLTLNSDYGGQFTEYLYKVKLSALSSITGQVLKLIIKGVTAHESPDEEAKNLNYLRTQKEVMKFHKSTNPNFPQLSLDLQNFWYFDSRSREVKYLTVLKKISGTMFYKYPIEDLPQIYEKVGRALGEMHYHLASTSMQDVVKLKRFNLYKTVCHHDFHGQNIFFNEKEDRAAFIDLESMAETHRTNAPYWHDIFLLYMREKYLDDNPKDYTVFNGWMNRFINGYVEAYPKTVRVALKGDIIKRIEEWSGVFKRIIQSKLPKNYKDSLRYSLYNATWFSFSIREDLINHKELTTSYVKAVKEDNFT